MTKEEMPYKLLVVRQPEKINTIKTPDGFSLPQLVLTVTDEDSRLHHFDVHLEAGEAVVDFHLKTLAEDISTSVIEAIRKELGDKDIRDFIEPDSSVELDKIIGRLLQDSLDEGGPNIQVGYDHDGNIVEVDLVIDDFFIGIFTNPDEADSQVDVNGVLELGGLTYWFRVNHIGFVQHHLHEKFMPDAMVELGMLIENYEPLQKAIKTDVKVISIGHRSLVVTLDSEPPAEPPVVLE